MSDLVPDEQAKKYCEIGYRMEKPIVREMQSFVAEDY